MVATVEYVRVCMQTPCELLALEVSEDPSQPMLELCIRNMQNTYGQFFHRKKTFILLTWK